MELFDSHFHCDGGMTPELYRRRIAEALEETPGAPRPDRLYLAAMGGDFADSLAAQAFAASAPGCVFACGVHPHNAEAEARTAADFAVLAADPRCRAIGELGVDFFYDTAPRERQLAVFADFLELALRCGRPAVVHCRDKDGVFDAYDAAAALLEPFAARGGRMVIHCFAGTPEWAERFLAMGALLGVTGMATFPRAENIRRTLAVIPDGRLLLETDSPYLAPIPHRGKPNNPGYLPLIAARVAMERGCSVEELAALTTANAIRFFGPLPTSGEAA